MTSCYIHQAQEKLILYIHSMDWSRVILGLEVLLALILMLRVFLVGIRTVRWMLFFLLIPTIVAPLLPMLSTKLPDVRLAWISFRVPDWICSVGVIYAFLSVSLCNFEGLLRAFRRAWTLTLAAGLASAAWLTHDLPDGRGSVISNVLALNRGIVMLAGAGLIFFVGLVFHYRIPIPQNLAKLSIGTTILFGVRILGEGCLLFAQANETVLWIPRVETVLWIGGLAYWTLFLSRSGEIASKARFAG